MSPSTVIRNLRCAGRMTFGLIAFGAFIADVGRHMLQREAQSIPQPNNAGLITDSPYTEANSFCVLASSCLQTSDFEGKVIKCDRGRDLHETDLVPLVYDKCLNGHPSLILLASLFIKCLLQTYHSENQFSDVTKGTDGWRGAGELSQLPRGDGDVHPGPTEAPGSHVVGVMGTERTGFVWIVSSAHAFPASCLVLSSQSLSHALLHLGSTQIM